jgi:hypothetical protein
LTAPNGVGVYVEAVRGAAPTSATVEFDLEAGARGLLRHFRDERRVPLSLDKDPAQEPNVLNPVFETGGHAYAFETLEEAGDSLEALDLNEGHYIGAFSDQGEVITMSAGDLWDHLQLVRDIRQHRHADPHPGLPNVQRACRRSPPPRPSDLAFSVSSQQSRPPS